MVKQVAKYAGLLIVIFVLSHLFTYIANVSATVQYHPFFPMGGKRQLTHIAAAFVPVLLPVIIGLLLGVIHIKRITAKKGKWTFNWILFILVVLPLLLLPLPTVLFNLHYNVVPLVNAVNQLLPESNPQSSFHLDALSIVAGFLFMNCFQKR